MGYGRGYFGNNCGCGTYRGYGRSHGCGCGHAEEHHHHLQNNVSTRNYYGRPVYVNHPQQSCCHSTPNKMHRHQTHCSCVDYDNSPCFVEKEGCCKPEMKQVAVIPTGTVGPIALFAGLECGTYMIIRSESEEQSVLTVDGVEQESTVGTEIVINPNTNGSVVINFAEATQSAGFLEIIKTEDCNNG